MLNVIEELKTAMKMPAGAEKDARLLVVRELKNKETELYPEKADAKLQHKWLEKMIWLHGKMPNLQLFAVFWKRWKRIFPEN